MGRRSRVSSWWAWVGDRVDIKADQFMETCTSSSHCWKCDVWHKATLRGVIWDEHFGRFLKFVSRRWWVWARGNRPSYIRTIRQTNCWPIVRAGKLILANPGSPVTVSSSGAPCLLIWNWVVEWTQFFLRPFIHYIHFPIHMSLDFFNTGVHQHALKHYRSGALLTTR